MRDIVTEVCAPLYVINKTVGKIKATVESKKDEYVGVIKTIDERGGFDKVDSSMLRLRGAGAYRISFGGGSINAYFDGIDTILGFSERDSSQPETKLRGIEELRTMFGLKKDEKASIVLEQIVKTYPLAVPLLGVDISKSTSVVTRTSKDAPSVDKAFDDIDNPVLKRKIDALIQSIRPIERVSDYTYMKKSRDALSEMAEFLKAIALENRDVISANPYIGFQEKSVLRADTEKLKLVSVDNAAIAPLVCIDDKPSTTIITLGWVGSLMEFEKNGIDPDLVSLLMRNRTNASRANAPTPLYPDQAGQPDWSHPAY